MPTPEKPKQKPKKTEAAPQVIEFSKTERLPKKALYEMISLGYVDVLVPMKNASFLLGCELREAYNLIEEGYLDVHMKNGVKQKPYLVLLSSILKFQKNFTLTGKQISDIKLEDKGDNAGDAC